MDEPKRRAVVLTALPVEYEAVASLLKDLCDDQDTQGTVYGCGLFEAEGQPWEVCIHEIGAGDANAALETERIITHFKPQVAFFVGVAAASRTLVWATWWRPRRSTDMSQAKQKKSSERVPKSPNRLLV